MVVPEGTGRTEGPKRMGKRERERRGGARHGRTVVHMAGIDTKAKESEEGNSKKIRRLFPGREVEHTKNDAKWGGGGGGWGGGCGGGGVVWGGMATTKSLQKERVGAEIGEKASMAPEK